MTSISSRSKVCLSAAPRRGVAVVGWWLFAVGHLRVCGVLLQGGVLGVRRAGGGLTGSSGCVVWFGKDS
jgi:hypothetical protein